MSTKTSIEAEHIGLGLFKASEEEVRRAAIGDCDTVVILTKKEYERLSDLAWRYSELQS